MAEKENQKSVRPDREEFQLTPEGKLDYRTTYNATKGALERTRD
jgi:hypothetical protein